MKRSAEVLLRCLFLWLFTGIFLPEFESLLKELTEANPPRVAVF